MGEMNKITCCSCRKNWEYRSGCGIRHSSLKAVAKEFEATIAEQLLQYGNENLFPIFHFSYMPARCSHCKEIVEVPFLEMEGGQYAGACPICSRKVEVIKDIEKWNCPSCGEKNLERSIIGNWD